MKVKTIQIIEVEKEETELRNLVKNECGYSTSNSNYIYVIKLKKNSFDFLDMLEPFDYHIGDVAHFRLM